MLKPKIILGVNTYHADSSACLIINGDLVAALEEERINRIKHYAGFPIKSIKECLKIGNISENDITDIAFNTKPLSNIIPKGFHYLRNLSIRENISKKRFFKKKNIHKIFKEKLNLNQKVKFHFIEHHLAHIASAFYPSEFGQTNGLSIDGSGDFVSLAYAECEKNKITIKRKKYFPNSLGIFYHAMTQFLGYQNYGDEYKIMGLAAYGKPIYYEKILTNLFKKSNNFFDLNLNFFNHHKNSFKYIADENLLIDQIYNSKLKTLFSEEMKNKSFNEDFASSVQKIYEHFFKKIISEVKKDEYSANLVFSGGCALNSSANRFLTNNNDLFQNIFINCAPGDNGGALGAAFVVAANLGQKLKNTKSPFLGGEFDENYIKKILDENYLKRKFEYKKIKSDEELFITASKYIAEGNVVGWFQGKMEFGPRALGNRSILADPRNPNMKEIINKKIKRRESFRPFAPSVLEEFQNDWFESDFNNPYMSSLAIVRKNKQKLIPSVTHIDETARLQTVNESLNPRFKKLIQQFNKITNVPILLNTSFNENEPIVMKPEEALDCLLRTDMDVLFINNFQINKL